MAAYEAGFEGPLDLAESFAISVLEDELNSDKWVEPIALPSYSTSTTEMSVSQYPPEFPTIVGWSGTV
jgi:hypothetical protein